MFSIKILTVYQLNQVFSFSPQKIAVLMRLKFNFCFLKGVQDSGQKQLSRLYAGKAIGNLPKLFFPGRFKFCAGQKLILLDSAYILTL